VVATTDKYMINGSSFCAKYNWLILFRTTEVAGLTGWLEPDLNLFIFSRKNMT
jgi:hypothetical protein